MIKIINNNNSIRKHKEYKEYIKKKKQMNEK